MKKRQISDTDLKNIKLIILDMDGTLLNKKGIVSDEMTRSIISLQKLGVYVSLASARLHTSMVHFADKLDINLPIISLDGALIKDKNDSFVLYQADLRARIVAKAVKLAEQFLIPIGLCHQNEIFYTEDSSTLPMILEKAGAKYTQVKSLENYFNNTLEIVCVSDNKKNLEQLGRKLKFPFTFNTSVNIYRARNYSEMNYLECKKSGSSKANAMFRLIKFLKVKEKNTLVAGDWYNDIPMFETKAIKIALKNSIPTLKKRADIVLKKTNDEDALLEIFDKIIFLKA